MARVVLADDHPLFLAALEAAVLRAGLDVVGKATRGDELLSLIDRVDADAVLLDMVMPGGDGIECITQIRARHPRLTIVAVSGADDEATVRRAMDAGAVCFVGKSADPADLAGAVRVLLSDAIHMAPAPDEGRNAAARTDTGAVLTPRETEILRLVANGAANGEVARSLWVTEQTVKFHLSNIYRKLDVSNRTGASRWAQQNGLLEDTGT